MANIDRILGVISSSTAPLDDDEISRRSEVRPRQTVNRICRELVKTDTLRRFVGAEGKIVNQLISVHDGSLPSMDGVLGVVERRSRHTTPPGDSQEQRAAERLMLDSLGQTLGLRLEPAKIDLLGGVRVEIDGVSEGHSVLVECWAHQGPPKGGQRNKVLADALKLSWVAGRLPQRPRLILCMSDDTAAAPFTGSRKWQAHALRDLGVEVMVAVLTDDVRAGIVNAQKRQSR